RSLLEIPYESPARSGRRRELARKAVAELRRRRHAVAPVAATDDVFTRILPEIRDAVLSQPDHPAWPLLDRPRVEALLSSPPAALDTMSRYYAWRLATVFGAVA